MGFIKLTGATMKEEENGERHYFPREEIRINTENIAAVYDHTILAQGNKIRVMESIQEIMEKIVIQYKEEERMRENEKLLLVEKQAEEDEGQ